MAVMTPEVLTTPTIGSEAALTPAELRHLGALEKRIERGLLTFREVGEALLEIRDTRLFRVSHPTFESYCRGRWQLERARVYQLMGAAEVASALPNGKALANEAQARELVPVFHSDPVLAARVWEHVTKGDAPVTAPIIREAVKALSGADDKPAVGPTPTQRLVVILGKATDEFVKWRASKPTKAERDDVQEALDSLTAVAAE